MSFLSVRSFSCFYVFFLSERKNVTFFACSSPLVFVFSHFFLKAYSPFFHSRRGGFMASTLPTITRFHLSEKERLALCSPKPPAPPAEKAPSRRRSQAGKQHAKNRRISLIDTNTVVEQEPEKAASSEMTSAEEKDELLQLEEQQIKSRTQFINLLINMGADANKFNSRVVLCEMVLKQACIATASLPSPNALRTSVACYAFDKVCSQFNASYQSIFASIRQELFSAIFAVKNISGLGDASTSVPTEVITRRSSLGSEAAAAHHYIGSPLYFEHARKYSVQLRRSRNINDGFTKSFSKHQLVLNRSIMSWQSQLKRVIFKGWRKWLHGSRADKWIRKHRKSRITAQMSRQLIENSFLRWRLTTELEKVSRLAEREATLVYQLGNATNQFTLQCFKAERYLVTIDELRTQLNQLAQEVASEKKKNYDASTLLNVEHNKRMNEVTEDVRQLTSVMEETMKFTKKVTAQLTLCDIPDSRADPLFLEEGERVPVGILKKHQSTRDMTNSSQSLLSDAREDGGAHPSAQPVNRNAEAVLLRWVNHILKKSDFVSASKKGAANFGSDWVDGEYLIIIMNKLAPSICHLNALQETHIPRRYESIIDYATKLQLTVVPRVQDLAEGVSDVMFLFLTELFKIYAKRTLARKEYEVLKQLKAAENENDSIQKSDSSATQDAQPAAISTTPSWKVTKKPPFELHEIRNFVGTCNDTLEMCCEDVQESKDTSSNWERLVNDVESQALEMRISRANGKPIDIIDNREFTKYTKVSKARLKDLLTRFTVGHQQSLAPMQTPVPLEAMLESVTRILKSNFQEIKRIYRYYCNLGGSKVGITATNFWKFCTDTRSIDKELNRNVIGTIFQKANSDSSVTVDGSREENPDTELVPAEFVECIIRMADVKIHAEPTLHQRVHTLLTTYVLPNVAKADISRFREEIYERPVQKVLLRYAHELQKVFRYYAGADKNSRSSRTINFMEFSKLLSDCHLLHPPLDEAAALSVFVAMQDRSEDEQDEYVYHEFVEGLVACTVYKYPCPYLPLENRVEHFLTTNILSHLRAKLKHQGIRIDPDLKPVALMSTFN
eukprot:TRINITY_DN13573_c0_g1_i1.p1 TRINITY_DN13573_c0_g1~~TRINITY_DN13573_c0_g1_i1.p1  ORF type:complete len:1070 (+),score=171.39 TRINITY_DN13573_c0_g1_i1:838-4047(+)